MSYHENHSDVVAQLTDYGLMVDTLDVDTARVVRCKTHDNQREKRGWYWLSTIDIDAESYIVGAYGIYVGNDNGKQKVKLSRKETTRLTTEQKKALADQQRAAKKKAEASRIAQHNRAADRAKTEWLKLDETGQSEYLDRKQVKAYGVRFGKLGEIIVPMSDASGSVRGLQIIYPNGHQRIEKTGRNKDFFPAGLGLSGTWHLIGAHPRKTLLVTEGYATGGSLHQATGHPVAVVWSANNLLAGCQALRKKYPRTKILICADDDTVQKCTECGKYTSVATADCQHCGQPHKKSNAGTTNAQAAALSINSDWIAPQFTNRPLDQKSVSDFNDLHVSESLDKVKTQINAKLSQIGVVPASTGIAVAPEGGGVNRQQLKSIITIDEALDRFSLVYGGNGTMFDTQEHCLIPKSDVMDILPEHGWRDMREEKTVVRMDEVGFDPAGTDKKIRCNLYGGWPTEPKKGKCSKLLELLRYLCSNDINSNDVCQWALNWLAYPIQHPGAKMQTALVLHGPQGTGKNLFFESIMAIYGEYGRIVDQSAIEDKFNDWASRKLFLIADEVVARTELYHVKNKLKSFVTGEWIRINPKNVTAHDEKNHVNLVFLSNESTPLVLEHDDRRYMVIHTPEKLPQDFYKEVRAEIDNGGVEALHHHLKNVDLGDFSIFTKPLATKAKMQLIEASLDSVKSFLRDWYMGEIDKIPFCPCLTSQLFDIYQKYCARVAEKTPRNQRQFISELNMQSGWRVGPISMHRSPYDDERKSRRMVIPSADLLTEKWEQYAKNSADSQGKWLAECHQAFTIAGEFPQ